MSEEIELDLEQLKIQIEETRAAMTGKAKQIVEVKEALADIQKQFAIMSRESVRLEQESKADYQTIRDLEKKIETAKRLELLKNEQERLAEEFAAKARELDSLTASAKWREFAFDHQIEGGKRLAVAKRGILGDKRGLGKTLSSLIWADMVEGKRVLVIAPNDVVPQFEEEIRHWAPSRTIFSLRGMPKSQRDLVYPMLNMVDEFIITLNYEAWRKDKTIVDDLIKAGIDTIICDEAHRIKSSDKITARGVFQIIYRPNYCPKCDKVDNLEGPWQQVKVTDQGRSVTLHDKFAGYQGKVGRIYHSLPVCEECNTELESTVKNVLCMTGTPILNKPQELFSLLFCVNMEMFPSEASFLYDYCSQYLPGKWRFRIGGLESLSKKMSNFFLQRDRNDAGIHVPPPAITIHTIEKDLFKYEKQYTAERVLTEKAALLLEDGTRKDIFFILEMILRERQVMTWPAGITITDPETKEVLCHFDVEESQKLDEATELLLELLEEDERVVIFSQFKAPLYELYNRVLGAGYTAAMATGDQTDEWKQGVRNDFDLKTAPENPRFGACFATFKAFGTGINLNAARHVILIDDEWNPGMEDQAIGRIDRMNSVDQANVHIFRVKNSIDDFMAAILEEKRGVTGEFNEAVGAAELMNFFKNRDK